MNKTSLRGGGDHEPTSIKVFRRLPTRGGVGAPNSEQRVQILLQRGERLEVVRLRPGLPGRAADLQLVEAVDEVVEFSSRCLRLDGVVDDVPTKTARAFGDADP